MVEQEGEGVVLIDYEDIEIEVGTVDSTEKFRDAMQKVSHIPKENN